MFRQYSSSLGQNEKQYLEAGERWALAQNKDKSLLFQLQGYNVLS